MGKLIIEIIGMHGSGKTALKRTLMYRWNANVVDAKHLTIVKKLPSNFIKIYSSICGRYKNISNRLIFLDKIVALQSLSKLSDNEAYYFKEYIASIVACTYDSKVNMRYQLTKGLRNFELFKIAQNREFEIIFDEGPARAGPTFARRFNLRDERNVRRLERYYKATPKPDILVVLNITTEQRLYNLSNRGGVKEKKIYGWGDNEMSHAIAVCKEIYQKQNVDIVEINNDAPMDKICDNLVRDNVFKK